MKSLVRVVFEPSPGVEADALALDGGAERLESPELGKLGFGECRVPFDRAGSFCRHLLQSGARSAWVDGAAQVATTTPNDPLFSSQWAAQKIGLPEAWDTTTGAPTVTIGLIDTGVKADAPDLAGNVLPGMDFVDSGDGSNDENGHGTAMAGVLVGRGNDGQGFAGVAWNCRLVPIRVGMKVGLGLMSDIARGVVWAVDHGVRVIVIGMGGAEESEAVERALIYAENHDVLVVAPAGNRPYGIEMYPARSPHVVCVASSDQDDNLAWGAAMGFQTDILAPVEATTTDIRGDTATKDGSSIAAAYVGGVAALLRSASPTLSARQVRAALLQEGDVLADPPLTKWFGVRRLNAAKALSRRDPQRRDIAVSGLRTLPMSPMPGQPSFVEVTVENRGNAQVESFSVQVSAGGRRLQFDHAGPGDEGDDREASREVGSLGVGERKRVAFRWVPGAGGNEHIDASVQGIRGDANPANDAASLDVVLSRVVQTDIAVTRATVEHVRSEQKAFDLVVTAENRGSRDETAIPLQITLNGVAVRHGQRFERLGIGQHQTRRIPMHAETLPDEGEADVEIAVGGPDSDATPDDNRAGLRFLLKPFAEGRSTPEVAETQYGEVPGFNIVTDTPWRVTEGGDAVIPVLFFFPGPGEFTISSPMSVLPTPTSLQIFPTIDPSIPLPPSGDSRHTQALYQNFPFASPPVVMGQRYDVRNENAGQVADHAILDTARRNTIGGGQHAVVKVSLRDIERASGGTHSLGFATDPMVFLTVQVKFARSLIILEHTMTNSYARVHGVEVAQQAFPTFGDDTVREHYFDPHFHTISEWTRSSKFWAPHKSFGGPLAMMVECGLAYNVLTREELPTDPNLVVTTDHNVFFNSTGEWDDAPSIPKVGPYLNGTPGQEWDLEGQQVGSRTRGQELALKTDNFIGAHALVYERPGPFAGPWHGGNGPGVDALLAAIPGVGEFALLLGHPADNIWPPGNVLSGLRQEDKGYAFIAHPLTSPNEMPTPAIDELLGLADKDHHYNDIALVTRGQREFLCKGIQVWNERMTRKMTYPISRAMSLDPYQRAVGFQPTENENRVPATFDLWQDSISRGLVWYSNSADAHASASDKDRKLVRKVFGNAGSDAHGDFGFATDTPSTVMVHFGLASPTASDNAWQKVRTYVYEQGFDGMGKGISCMTDGPLVRFTLDSDDRFDVEQDPPFWHDRSFRFENEDGKIGGDGDLDGKRTMLYVPQNKRYVLARVEQANTADFAGLGSFGKMRWWTSYLPRDSGARFLWDVFSEDGVGTQTRTQSRVELPEGRVNRLPFTPWALTLTSDDPHHVSGDDHLGITNPAWAVPVQIDIYKFGQSQGAILANFLFPISMKPDAFTVEARQLDSNGDSTLPPQEFTSARSNNGWTESASRATDPDDTVENGSYWVTNIFALGVDTTKPYPAASRYTFVIYIKHPRDAAGNNGNELNTVGATFQTDASGTPIGCPTINVPPGGFVVTPHSLVPGFIQTVAVRLPTEPFMVRHADGSTEVAPFGTNDISFNFGPFTQVVVGSIQAEGGTTYSMDVRVDEAASPGMQSLTVDGETPDRHVCFTILDAVELLPSGSPIIVPKPGTGVVGTTTTLAIDAMNIMVDPLTTLTVDTADIDVTRAWPESPSQLMAEVHIADEAQPGLHLLTMRSVGASPPRQAQGLFRVRHR